MFRGLALRRFPRWNPRTRRDHGNTSQFALAAPRTGRLVDLALPLVGLTPKSAGSRFSGSGSNWVHAGAFVPRNFPYRRFAPGNRGRGRVVREAKRVPDGCQRDTDATCDAYFEPPWGSYRFSACLRTSRTELSRNFPTTRKSASVLPLWQLLWALAPFLPVNSTAV
jgi:hypothetical protein